MILIIEFLSLYVVFLYIIHFIFTMHYVRYI